MAHVGGHPGKLQQQTVEIPVYRSDAQIKELLRPAEGHEEHIGTSLHWITTHLHRFWEEILTTAVGIVAGWYAWASAQDLADKTAASAKAAAGGQASVATAEPVVAWNDHWLGFIGVAIAAAYLLYLFKFRRELNYAPKWQKGTAYRGRDLYKERLLEFFDGDDFSASVLRKAEFVDKKMTDVSFSRADLSGVELHRLEATGCWFNWTDFSGSTFYQSTFAGRSRLTRAQFRDVVHFESTILDTRLDGSKWIGSSIRNSTLVNVQLDRAKFRRCAITKTVLRGVDFCGADLSGLELDEPSASNARRIYFDANTRWPKNGAQFNKNHLVEKTLSRERFWRPIKYTNLPKYGGLSAVLAVAIFGAFLGSGDPAPVDTNASTPEVVFDPVIEAPIVNPTPIQVNPTPVTVVVEAQEPEPTPEPVVIFREPTTTLASQSSALEPPAKPRSVEAAAGDEQVTVSWDMPKNDGTSSVTQFVAVANPGGQRCKTAGDSQACTITGLENGNSYAIGVVAKSADGTSPSAATTATPVPPPNRIVVTARGALGSEEFDVLVGDVIVGTATTTTENKRFIFESPHDLEGAVTVAFVNDYSDGHNFDRTLWVDKINVNGVKYESESPSTYADGVWAKGAGCGSGFMQTEQLSCAGTFTYTKLVASS